jgi:hypothetical protein
VLRNSPFESRRVVERPASTSRNLVRTRKCSVHDTPSQHPNTAPDRSPREPTGQNPEARANPAPTSVWWEGGGRR